jgi:hypothetical protein
MFVSQVLSSPVGRARARSHSSSLIPLGGRQAEDDGEDERLLSMSQDHDYFYPGRWEEEAADEHARVHPQRLAATDERKGEETGGETDPLWWEKKEPLVLRSFVLHFLKDEHGELKDDIDLEAHGQESRQTITNATVQEVTEMNPRLKGLTLNNCSDVTDVGLWSVARNCTAIRALRTHACFRLTLIGLRAISLRCASLEELDLRSIISYF